MDWFWWGLIGLLLILGVVALVVWLNRPKAQAVVPLVFVPLAEEPPPPLWVPVTLEEAVSTPSPYTPIESIPRISETRPLRNGAIVGPTITTYEPAGVRELNATLV